MQIVVRPPLRSLLSLAALMSLLGFPARAESSVESEAAIRFALETWTTAFNTGDTAKVCDLFARDLVASYQGQPERGHEAICALLMKSLTDTSRAYRYSLDLKEIIVSGDLAAVRLTWTLEIDPKNGGPKLVNVEPGLDIFRRQADGSWRIQRYLAYPANP
ncbi:MAG: nuclear transport factor 2 family protein [Proteobacteria bacterium]|nr:nuclear transport factor 2 family protein [Pseudomonadota bacterium]